MTIAIILVVTGFLSLAALIYLAKGRPLAAINPAELRQKINSLDINAFRNVIDPDEEDFLRRRLSPAEFRLVQRERGRAAIGYVILATHNASILHWIGVSARISATPSVADAGDKLANCAMQFRIYGFQILARLYFALILPNPRIHPLGIAEGYEDMNSLVVLLRCLQQQGSESSRHLAAQLS